LESDFHTPLRDAIDAIPAGFCRNLNQILT
jgi:hypothetical protein